jgi:hypothetical protein
LKGGGLKMTEREETEEIERKYTSFLAEKGLPFFIKGRAFKGEGFESITLFHEDERVFVLDLSPESPEKELLIGATQDASQPVAGLYGMLPYIKAFARAGYQDVPEKDSRFGDLARTGFYTKCKDMPDLERTLRDLDKIARSLR